MFQESFLRFGGRKSPREARLGNATREAGEERGPPHTIEVSQDISHLTSVKIVHCRYVPSILGQETCWVRWLLWWEKDPYVSLSKILKSSKDLLCIVSASEWFRRSHTWCQHFSETQKLWLLLLRHPYKTEPPDIWHFMCMIELILVFLGGRRWGERRL